MGLLNLYNLLDAKTLVQGLSNPDTFQLPAMIQGEQISLNFFLLQRNPNYGVMNLNPFTLVLPATYSLRVGIYSLDGSLQLAYQNGAGFASQPNGSYSGSLPQNSANIGTALGLTNGILAYIEFEITDSSGYPTKTYQAQVQLLKQFLPAGAPTVPATEVAATQSWVQGTFAKRQRLAGEFDIWTTPNGTQVVATVGDDLQWTFTPLQTPP